MCLGSVLLLMIDRPHTEISFFRSEGIFHFGQLNISLPYRLRIGLLPVSAQNVAATAMKCPLIAVFIPPDSDLQLLVFTVTCFCNGYLKEGCGPAVSLKQPSDSTLRLLLVPEPSLFCLFFEFVKPCLQTNNKPVEYCCLFKPFGAA